MRSSESFCVNGLQSIIMLSCVLKLVIIGLYNWFVDGMIIMLTFFKANNVELRGF